MEAIYQIIETILPFEPVQYNFMKNAIIAILLLCPAFTLLRDYDSK